MGTKILFFSDVHEDLYLLDQVGTTAKEVGASGAICGGDMVEGDIGQNNGNHKTLDEYIMEDVLKIDSPVTENHKIINKIYTEANIPEGTKVGTVNDLLNILSDEDDKKRLVKASEITQDKKLNEELNEQIDKIIRSRTKQSCDRLNPHLKRIGDNTEHGIVENLVGNHGNKLLPQDDYLGKVTHYGEHDPHVDMEGIILQFAQNTYEKPGWRRAHPNLNHVFAAKYDIDFGAGRSLADLAGEEKEYAKILQDEELKRLRSGKKADVLVLHKRDAMNAGEWAGTSDAIHTYCDELSAEKEITVLYGHEHDLEIAWRNNRFELRPGVNHYFELEYDDNNKLKAVDIWEVKRPDSAYAGTKREARQQKRAA